ncbi:hypothetical protein [Nocardioides caldifontis]|uniref:hypothetical protein n=1 Tax=Nocardioides caldifontis TaxID=2588938 RepID=UPI0011E031FA|nr:hypothetical protein [Nocardioides caldifontis]
MYTLLGASVLGFDLVRRSGGGAVASLLVEAMALTADDLPLLAKAQPLGLLSGADRAEVSDALERSPMVAAMGEMSRLVAGGRVTEALHLLETAPMAGLPELMTFVRDEVLEVGADEVAAAAAEVVCDAVVAAFHAPTLRSGLSEQLVEPWAAAQQLLPRRALGLGPCEPEVVALLDRLSRLDDRGWARLQQAAQDARALGGWAPAMHSATWAVQLSGRVREAAAAQLRAVRVLVDAGVTPSEAARGLWNFVSGALQASVAGDLVDEDTELRLVLPLTSALPTP